MVYAYICSVEHKFIIHSNKHESVLLILAD